MQAEGDAEIRRHLKHIPIASILARTDFRQRRGAVVLQARKKVHSRSHPYSRPSYTTTDPMPYDTPLSHQVRESPSNYVHLSVFC